MKKKLVGIYYYVSSSSSCALLSLNYENVFCSNKQETMMMMILMAAALLLSTHPRRRFSFLSRAQSAQLSHSVQVLPTGQRTMQCCVCQFQRHYGQTQADPEEWCNCGSATSGGIRVRIQVSTLKYHNLSAFTAPDPHRKRTYHCYYTYT